MKRVEAWLQKYPQDVKFSLRYTTQVYTERTPRYFKNVKNDQHNKRDRTRQIEISKIDKKKENRSTFEYTNTNVRRDQWNYYYRNTYYSGSIVVEVSLVDKLLLLIVLLN